MADFSATLNTGAKMPRVGLGTWKVRICLIQRFCWKLKQAAQLNMPECTHPPTHTWPKTTFSDIILLILMLIIVMLTRLHPRRRRRR